MRGVHIFSANFVDLVEHVQQIAFSINSGAFDTGEDFGDDLLPWGGVGPLAQALQVGDQVGVNKALECPERPERKQTGSWIWDWGFPVGIRLRRRPGPFVL